MHSIRWTAVTLISLSTTAACAPSGGAAGPAAVAEDRLLADSLDPFIRRWVDEGYVPGLAVAVVRRGGPVYLRGFGVRDVQSRAPVTPSTVFYIASST
ncbi:MAG TPA: serine hydrolase domain-containing protein, partial [Longimicrobium sp.]|nr:serine hydrolase domain-containing protein [Longimicrobium sp.]